MIYINLGQKKTVTIIFTLIVTIFSIMLNNSLANEFITTKTYTEYPSVTPQTSLNKYVAFSFIKDGTIEDISDKINPTTNAYNFVRIRIFPEHVGVFTTVGKQQFVAFGVKKDGKKINITKQVDWKSSNPNIVSINRWGVAKIINGKTSGQVKISCSYPKKPKGLKGLTGPYHLLLRTLPETLTEPKKSLSYLYFLLLRK